MDNFKLQFLPPKVDLETKRILKKCMKAHRILGELKGVALSIPNENILIDSLALQEAKDSSEVENIVTTHDDLYKFDLFKGNVQNPAAKEVSNYIKALKSGFSLVRENGLLTQKYILKIQELLEENRAGYRKLPGTAIKNLQTQELVYTPPQDSDEIIRLMGNLENYINSNEISDVDPLIKMSVIHHQFESIHPFYDGNGRTGRIINILYLVKEGLLELPILYLSRYIIQYKADYYRLLREVNETGKWEDWVLFMLDSIEQTASQTIGLIQEIRSLMRTTKRSIRNVLPKIYSQDLINNLFQHPYTKIDFLQKDLKIRRQTASRYLDMLTQEGFLKKSKVGRNNYYVNESLLDILLNLPSLNQNLND